MDSGAVLVAAVVSGEWAEANLDTPGVVFVEVAESASAADDSHIPGAVTVDLRDPPSTEQFESLLSATGIENNDTIVLCARKSNRAASFAYWCFKLHGHEDVRVLAGGRKKWEFDARPLTSDAVTRLPTNYVAAEADASTRAFRDEVLAGIGGSCAFMRSESMCISSRR
jgi:thiosulfate/3-mercaptopyruvate sulfurtransferase